MGSENAQQLNIFDMFNVPQDTSPSKFELSAESTEIGEAWQYEMRKKYAKQEAVFPYWQDYDLRVSVSVVREISFTQAKEIIEKYEWLGCMPVSVRHC
jgi:hypothetical protein